MEGIEHLRRARQELKRSDGTARARLRVAARQFWQAVFDFESWPPPLQGRAAGILRRLFTGGVIDETVQNASSGTIETLSDEIEAFSEEAERHDLRNRLRG
ncbi:MAG: hypothetical protein H0T47_11760 [Planctomycetaceae bacterium]|nr:hypothetical protein [Planctomycetaceae bacterium]